MVRRFHGRLCACVLSTCALTANVSSAHRQEPPPSFTRIPDEAGLSHNSVYALHRDREGFLWAGTADGLNRFDGYEFRVFRHEAGEQHSLSGNVVWDITEDRTGRLWIATDGGLNRLRRDEGGFERFAVGDPDPARPAAWTRILEDTAGTVWVGTPTGLFRLDEVTGVFVAQPLPVESRGGISAMALDPSGDLWVTVVGPERGTLVNVGSGKFAEAPRDPLFDAFGFDKDGRIWFAPNRPARIDLDRGSVTREGWGARVLAVERDPAGALWFGTSDGLLRRDSAGAARIALETSDEAYVFGFVRSLHLDDAGLVWVGTQGGLYVHDPNAKRFRTLRGDPRNPDRVSSRAFSAIRMEPDSTMWIGTFGEGLHRVDRSGKTTHVPAAAPTVGNDIIWALHRSSGGILYVGTNHGLYSLDEARLTYLLVPLGPGAGDAYAVQYIAEAPDGWLWLGGVATLFGYNPATGERRWVKAGPGGLSSATIGAVTVDRTGAVWVGSGRSALDRFEPATKVVTRFDLKTAAGEPLSGEAIWDLFADAGGALWLATGSGLGRLEPGAGVFTLFDQGSGPNGSVVYAIEQDEAGALWLATNRGLASFDPSHPEAGFRGYDVADGVGSTEFNRQAVFETNSGELLFGGMNGLTRFYPSEIRDNPRVPRVVITRVESSGKSGVQPLGPRTGAPLAHDQNTISFEFASLSFSNPAQNRYRYLMEGVDGDWVEAGNRRFARYPALTAGRYTFKVLGSNDDGVWSDEPAMFAFSVAPAVWATPWFRGLLVLLGVGLLYGGYRYRVQGLLKMERLRLRIAGDLHDDLSSNLSAVALMSELVGESDRLADPDRDRLEKIGRTARGMVEDVRDLVWIVDPGRDTIADFEAKLKDAAASLLGAYDYSITTDFGSTSRILSMEVRRQVYLIYKETLHNVVRHAQATRVEIHIGSDRDSLRCRIEDNGKGFNPETLGTAGTRGMGLANLQRRAAAIGAELTLRSAPGNGTSVVLAVPLR